MTPNRYSITLTGVSPLLLHHDNLAWSGFMQHWMKDPNNKTTSVPGDDRSPAFTWIGCLYEDAGQVVIPSDNLMTVLREGGKRCPTGKRQGTFKSQTQSGILVNEASWPLIGAKGAIPIAPIKALIEVPEFEKHEAAALSLGFELFSKRAKIGKAKHVRVRPRFDMWSCSGTMTVLDEMITKDVLQNILTFAGRYAGIGDWRPSSPMSPGRFGTFTATVEQA